MWVMARVNHPSRNRVPASELRSVPSGTLKTGGEFLGRGQAPPLRNDEL